LPSRPNQNVQTQESLVSANWSPNGLHRVLSVPQGDHCNSTFFANVAVLDLQTDLCSGTRRKTLKYWKVHLENALAHNSWRSREAIKATGAGRVPHAAYSPEVTRNDFCLFGYPKEKSQSVAMTD
jgi:hypothetical protein